MVAGNHHRAYARSLAFLHGRPDLRANRVYHAHQAYEAELLLEVGGIGIFRHPVPQPLRGGQYAQSLRCHGVIALEYLGSLCLRHGLRLAVLHIIRAAGKHLVRRALGVLHYFPALIVQGRHHLSGGIEGGLAYARLFFLQLIFL